MEVPPYKSARRKRNRHDGRSSVIELNDRRRLGDENVVVWMKPMDPSSANTEVVAPPLSLRGIPPGTMTGLARYSSFLVSVLLMFVGYLILPKGFRKAYCRSGRRRYTRRQLPPHGRRRPPVPHHRPSPARFDDPRDEFIDFEPSEATASSRGAFTASEITNEDDITIEDSILRQTEALRADDNESMLEHMRRVSNRAPSSIESAISSLPMTSITGDDYHFAPPRRRSIPASPSHPGVASIPPVRILNGMMERLEASGLRLLAHGIQCVEPKRVWIQLDTSREVHTIVWQTEVPRIVSNTVGDSSTLMTRGPSHALPLLNVLYVDVGKRTSALLGTSDHAVPELTCLSLLTSNGSLDLQCQSRLERDALVSCLSLLLDEAHGTERDWRSMYHTTTAAAPDSPSRAGGSGDHHHRYGNNRGNSRNNNNGHRGGHPDGMSSVQLSAISSDAFDL